MKKMLTDKRTMLWVGILFVLITLPTTLSAQNPGSYFNQNECTALKVDMAILQASLIGFAAAGAVAPPIYVILGGIALLASIMVQFGC